MIFIAAGLSMCLPLVYDFDNDRFVVLFTIVLQLYLPLCNATVCTRFMVLFTSCLWFCLPQVYC